MQGPWLVRFAERRRWPAPWIARILGSALAVLAGLSGAREARAESTLLPVTDLVRQEHVLRTVCDWSGGLVLERSGWSAAVLAVVRDEHSSEGRSHERSVEFSLARGLGSGVELGLAWSFDPEEGVGSAELKLALGFEL